MEIINKNLKDENVGGDAACNIICGGSCAIYVPAAFGGWASKAL